MATTQSLRMTNPGGRQEIRPKPIGEETDTCSQKSGKSSNKSNSSSKRGSRESSRTHSPVVHTPRKSSKQGLMSELTNCEGGDEEFAPLGYEPCGSAENISPFSERSTPPYLEWARDLQYVLNDYDGQDLFRKYLSQETCCNALDFYYACKGLNKLAFNDESKIKELVLAIYRRYIRPQGDEVLSCVKKGCREQISAAMHAKDYQQSIFDTALSEAEEFLRMKHAAFVESEIYLDYVQRIQVGELDSPRLVYSDQESNSSSSSTSGDPPRSAAQFLPTVQEEETEEGSGRESSQSVEGQQKLPFAKSPPPLPPRRPQGDHPVTGQRGLLLAPKGKGQVLPKPKKAASVVSAQRDADPFSVVTMRTLEATMHQRSSALQKNSPGVPPNPYHVNYVPRLPPSTQDSELQSMSSDADSFSMTESFSNEFAKRVQLNNHRQNHKDRYLKHTQQYQNLESNISNLSFIPRTSNPPPQRTLHSTERDRAVFHRLLTEKLEVVVREREKEEKLRESLLRLSEPTAESNPRARRAVAEEYSSYVKSVAKTEDDTTILDYHMQQLGWNDSEKASPHRSPGASLLQPAVKTRPSPGSKSPERWGFGRQMTSSYPSALILAKSSAYSAAEASSGYPDVSGTLPSQKQRSHHQSGAHGRNSVSGIQTDKRQTPQPKMRPMGKGMGPTASDTSGIESGTSSGASQVSALIPAQYSDGAKSRNKQTPTGCHRPSSHKGSSDKQQKGQKTVDSASLPRTHKSRRSEGAPWTPVSPAPASVFSHQVYHSQLGSGGEVSVGYYLPNDTAPFVTKTSRNVTLKQFKQLLPKKYQEGALYKYFFKCASNEFETGGVVQKEVTDDFEVLPLWEGKVMAKVVDYR